jgi:DNA-binding CsgD family transcriptional regulator
MYRGATAEECADLAARATERAATMEVDTGLTWVVGNVVLVAAERPEARDVWERALARSHRQGSMFGVLTVHLWRGFTQLRHGELPAAEESLRSGIEQITLLGGATLDYAHGLLCSTLLERGRTDEAAAALGAIERPEGVGDGALLWRSAEIELLLARGEWQPALDAAVEHAELCDWRINPAFAQTLSFQARALEGLGRTEEAVAVADEALARAEGWGAPGTVGRVLRIRGEIRRAEGIEDLERAVALLEDSPMQLELAKALASLGGTRRRGREPKEAREPLRRAYELAEVCGATELASAIRTELHATGARPRGSALKGPESLTPSERRVADLAVEGMTNKAVAQALYVTPKTVEVHLSNAYRKLEIGSRRELAAALGESP